MGCLLNKLQIRDNPIPPENLPVYVLLLIPSAIPILISKKKTGEIKATRRYETIFRKGFFQNCSLQQGGSPCVKIDNAIIDDKAGKGFVEVKCKNCGGTSRIRADSSSPCSFCDAPLLGKIETK